jgi:hypothetical protein
LAGASAGFAVVGGGGGGDPGFLRSSGFAVGSVWAIGGFGGVSAGLARFGKPGVGLAVGVDGASLAFGFTLPCSAPGVPGGAGGAPLVPGTGSAFAFGSAEGCGVGAVVDGASLAFGFALAGGVPGFGVAVGVTLAGVAAGVPGLAVGLMTKARWLGVSRAGLRWISVACCLTAFGTGVAPRPAPPAAAAAAAAAGLPAGGGAGGLLITVLMTVVLWMLL